MAKFKIVDGVMVRDDEPVIMRVAPDPPPQAEDIILKLLEEAGIAPAVKTGNVAADLLELEESMAASIDGTEERKAKAAERRRVQSPEAAECGICHRWYSPDAGLPAETCSHCYAQTRPSTANGTPFDLSIKEQAQTNGIVVYAPSIEQIRDFFNLEVEGHGIIQDHWFVQEVLQHKFIKPAKDCTVEENIAVIDKYERVLFELQATTQARKIHVRQRSKAATDAERELIKKMDGEYKSPEAVKVAKDKRVASKKVVNLKAALDGLRVMYGASTGLSGAALDEALKVQFPTLFE